MNATLRITGEGVKTVIFSDGDNVSDVLNAANVNTDGKVVRVNGALVRDAGAVPAMDNMTVDVSAAAKAA